MAVIVIPDELIEQATTEAALAGRSVDEYVVKAIGDRLLHDRDKRLGIAKTVNPGGRGQSPAD